MVLEIADDLADGAQGAEDRQPRAQPPVSRQHGRVRDRDTADERGIAPAGS